MQEISPTLLSNLSSQDKETFLSTLSELIAQIDSAQKDFIELKDLFGGVLEVLPQAIWVLNEGGDFFYFNSQAYKISSILENILPLSGSVEVEFEGSFYLIQGLSVGDKQVITATNITDQKRQERLASMGQVSAHLAHEIRNPVGSISLLTSALQKRVDTGSKSLVYEIKKAVYRVESIIKATLMFSKGVMPQKSIHSLEVIQENTQEILNYTNCTKSYKINFDFPKNAQVWCDIDLLVIVLQNFLSNAIDAIEEGECEEGEIKIAYKEDEECYSFAISDNGKEVRDSKILFEPFKTTKLKGTGLGLALCMQIIEAHDGSINFIPFPKTFIIKISK